MIRVPRTRGLAALLAAPLLTLLALPAAGAAPAPPQGEFSASGEGVLRIESEIKLTVPDEDVEPLWSWLRERYADLSWLEDTGRRYRVGYGDELFRDTYFDDQDLAVLARKGGVRHRRRAVLSGAAASKNGRELLQIKLATEDAEGVARGEIKFVVDPPGRAKEPGDGHPLLGLIARAQRDQVIRTFRGLGLDALAMRPVLTVEQVRRRVYLSDDEGALATLTLDQCSCGDFGTQQAWTEIELELNEIRYTEADAAGRRELERIVGLIEQDVLAAFPGIRRDQTPKYAKAFQGIERGSVLPVRLLVRAGWSMTDALAVGGLLVLLAGVVAFARVARRRQRPA